MLALATAALATAMFVGGGSYFSAKTALDTRIRDDLRGPIENRVERLQHYATSVTNDLEFLAEMRDVGLAFAQFTKAVAASREENGEGPLRDAYVDMSAKPVGERHLVNKADDGSKYSTLHSLFHPTLRSFLFARGYYDIFLINPDGEIVYSVYKETDFLTNLSDGPYSASGLADAFSRAAALEPGQIAFADFTPYTPSSDAAAAFVATPVFAAARFGAPVEFQGVVAIQLPQDRLEAAVMVESAESAVQTFIVGDDGVVRTDLQSTPEPEAMKATFDLSGYDAAEFSVVDGIGLGGRPSVLALGKTSFLGAPWTVVTQVDSGVAMSVVQEVQNGVLLTAALALAFVTTLAWVLGRSLSKPILEVDIAMKRMADGDLETPLLNTGRTDEIGSIIRNTDAFRSELFEADKTRKVQEARNQELEERRQSMLAELEANVGAVVTAVSRGELDTRVSPDFDDDALNALSKGVNRICDVVGAFLTQTENIVEAMSDGNLTVRFQGDFSGRFMEVGNGLNETIANLDNTVQRIKTTGDEMTRAIRLVADGSTDLAERAESQAASLEETAATMEEISATINLNADNALKATDLAGETQSRAKDGQSVVEDAVAAMGEIETSSSQITDIISVIDSIAFQTNLLALNAAVEAARAGDAGKGFAVVASEVRTLAQRSAAAAKDITDLITVSSNKVSDGVRLVNATGDALGSILTSISTFSERITEISTASKDQSVGVSQISESVSHMDDMTQQNARLADNSASAAKSLTGMSDELNALIVTFKTNQNEPQYAVEPNGEREEVSSEKELPLDPTAQKKASVSDETSFAEAGNATRSNEAIADQEWLDLVGSRGSIGTNADEKNSRESGVAAVGEDWADF